MSIEGKIVRVAMLNRFYQELPNFFVRKETGKGLSTNDYTNDEKADVAKIADIETDLESKVDGEVYDESGYVTGVSFKKGSYSIDLGTNAGDPRISIKNDTTVNFDLAQTKELTRWTVYDTGLALYGPEYSSALPVLTFSKTNDGVSIEATHDTGVIKGVPSTELTSKTYVDSVGVRTASFHNNKGQSNQELTGVGMYMLNNNYVGHMIQSTANGYQITIVDEESGGDVQSVTKSLPDEARVSALIADELADISGVDFVVVAANEELPATGAKGKFYLKATGTTGSNKYDEYVWVNHGTAESPDYGYEKLGTMDVDLTGYIKESDLQFATTEDILAIFNGGGN